MESITQNNTGVMYLTRNEIKLSSQRCTNRSTVIFNHIYNKNNSDIIKPVDNLNLDGSVRIVSTKQNDLTLKGFTPVECALARQEYTEFALSDSEYGSLKNEKYFNTNTYRSKLSVVKKICDSTTDLDKSGKNQNFKEIPPDPKVSTTTAFANNSIFHLNKCESSSDYTSYPGYSQENRSIPFKKRYIHYLNETAGNSIQPVTNNLVSNVSDTDLSCTSSSTPNNDLDTTVNNVNEDHTEPNIKVKSWKVDFKSAYNNDYIDFNEEHCMKLQAKINQAKTNYESQLLKKNHLTASSTSIKFKMGSENKKNDNNTNLYNHNFSVVSGQQLLNLKRNFDDTEPGCSISNNLEKLPNKNLKLNANIDSTNLTNECSVSDMNSEENSLKNKNRKKFLPTPLSPETTKRNEFYSYLQISAKPRLRSDGTPVEPNRRSVRVKNIEISKQRDRSLSEELKSNNNLSTKEDRKRIALSIAERRRKYEIRKLFMQPKVHKKKKLKKSRKKPLSEKNNNTKNIQLVQNKSKVRYKKKINFTPIIQTRRSLYNCINLRSKTKLYESKVKNRQIKDIKTDNRTSIEKLKTTTEKSKTPIESAKKLIVKSKTIMDRSVMNISDEQIESREVFEEYGFTAYDRHKSLNQLHSVRLAKCEIDRSVKQLTGLISQTSKQLNQTKNENNKTEKVRKNSETKLPILTNINHINGPVTRHSNAAINKTLTRSSRKKMSKLNLDAVMKRMQQQHKTKLVTKTKLKSNEKYNNNNNLSSSTKSVDHELVQKSSNVSSLLSAVNDEVLKVQNNILELSAQYSCYEGDLSDCSTISEHNFRGFKINNPDREENISESTSENVVSNSRLPSNQDEETTSTGTSSSSSYTDFSSSNNCIEPPEHLKVSVQTYKTDELEPKSDKLIPLDNVQNYCDNCTNELVDCKCHTLTSNNGECSSTPTKCTPMSSPHLDRSFHQIFNKKNPKYLIVSSVYQVGQESNVDSSNWPLLNNDLNPNPSSVEIQMTPEKNTKQLKIISPPQIIDKKSEQHVIDINDNGGPVLNVHFVDITLVIVQEHFISFWQQTALGTMLGAQNMWLSLGKLQRLKLEMGRDNIRSQSQQCFKTDNATAFVELWAKEHKSEWRECPISDVFATVYFHQTTKKGSLLEKKVIQLENIKSFTQDVHFVCLKYNRSIIVSWWNQFPKLSTQIRKYQLANDFQTVCDVMDIESSDHYVSSLYDVRECSEMVLGIGDFRVTIWHLQQGKLITTVTIQNPRQSQVSNLNSFYDINCIWTSYDRNFIFLLNKTENNILTLIAINGLRKDWKNLQTYRIPSEHTEIRSVIIDGGILSICSKNGIVCWSLQSGKLLRQCSSRSNLSVYMSDTHVTLIDQHFNVSVKNIFSFLLED